MAGEGSSVVTAEAWVAAGSVPGLAWELPHAVIIAKKKKKRIQLFAKLGFVHLWGFAQGKGSGPQGY